MARYQSAAQVLGTPAIHYTVITDWIPKYGVRVLVCFIHYLKEAAGILVTQVNVDHLQQCPNFIIAHFIILVLVGSPQVSMNPGEQANIVKESETTTTMLLMWKNK